MLDAATSASHVAADTCALQSPHNTESLAEEGFVRESPVMLFICFMPCGSHNPRAVPCAAASPARVPHGAPPAVQGPIALDAHSSAVVAASCEGYRSVNAVSAQLALLCMSRGVMGSPGSTGCE